MGGLRLGGGHICLQSRIHLAGVPNMIPASDLTQEFWRAAAIAWGCFVIGVYCFRVAMADPQRVGQLVGVVLSRLLIFCGMIVLTGFGSHAVQEYKLLAISQVANSDVSLNADETLVAQVTDASKGGHR